MWCVGELDAEYVERMEDLLDLYERPLDPEEPVVCVDEKPVQLLAETRDATPSGCGRIAKRDFEYRRCGTANIFAAVEPKAGRHMPRVTRDRKAPRFAEELLEIALAYPDARTIHLVLDNLNTHSRASVERAYGEEHAQRLWRRFTIHYTPKHGSWLNQAEIALGLISREALGKSRIETRGEMRAIVAAWGREATKARRVIGWHFTTSAARKKFGYESKIMSRPRH